MSNFLKKMLDVLGGLFLIITGSIIFLLYFCLRNIADNAFISLSTFLFTFCMGLGGIILGIRRICLVFVFLWQNSIAINNELINQQEKPQRKNVLLRIVFGILWFIPIHLVTNIMIGGVVCVIIFSMIAATSMHSSGAVFDAGLKASINFFRYYGFIIFVIQFLLTLFLSFFGVLPGTSKFKR